MKILLVQTGFLGDVVLSTPCLPLIRRQFPDAQIDILVTPKAASIMSGHPLVHSVKLYDKRGAQRGLSGLWQMAQALRAEKYQLAISLHKSLRTAALLWLAGIPRRVGFKEAAAKFLYTQTVKRSDLQHEVLRNAAIMRAFGVNPQTEELPLAVYPSEGAVTRAGQLLADLARPIVGIAPGSVWLTKRWTEQGFAELTKLLTDAGVSVVLLGGPEDAALGEFVLRNTQVPASGRIRNLVGQTNLAESAAVIAQCDVMVTNDSAPLHLAAAAKTPVVAIFCATIPEFGFGPWGTKHQIIQVENLACRPCGRHGGNSCPTGTHACRTGVEPQRVFLAIQHFLSRLPQSAEEVIGK